MFAPSQHEVYYLDAFAFMVDTVHALQHRPQHEDVLVAAATVYLIRTYRIPTQLAEDCAIAAVVNLYLPAAIARDPK